MTDQIDHEKAILILADLCSVMASAIRACGATGLPEGLLYAAAMERGMNMTQFKRVIDGVLIKSGVIRRNNNVLYYIDKAPSTDTVQ